MCTLLRTSSESGRRSEFERRLRAVLTFPEVAAVVAPLEVSCGGCDGVGVVLDPEWADWRAREWDARVAFERARPDTCWLYSQEFTRLRAEQLVLPRDEELPCLDCDGSGAVPTEAGRVLLGFLRRHLTL